MSSLLIPLQASTPENLAALSLTTKIVQNIIKNPADPKFRRINLAGAAGSKLTAAPSSVAFLKSVGFVEGADGHLELADSSSDGLPAALAALEAASATAVADARGHSPASVAGGCCGGGDPLAGMSLKQKAVYMAEQKGISDRANAKRVRDAELEKLEQDKLVRQTDPNWASAAAGVKGGKPIETFRGKFGEDKGG